MPQKEMNDFTMMEMNQVYTKEDLIFETTGIDFEAVHNRLREMLVAIIDIFETNGICYLINSGTLIGAIRHKGFIPWDYDADLFVVDDDYTRAKDLLRSNLPYCFILEDEQIEPKYFHAWAHVKDLDSWIEKEMYPQDNIYSHKGISIDLYRLKKMPFHEVTMFHINEEIRYLNRRFEVGAIEKNDYFTRIRKANEAKRAYDLSNDSDARMVWANISGDKVDLYYEDSLLFPTKKYMFENLEINGPNNADAMLRGFYGDYWKLPDYKDRTPKCKVEIWNHKNEIQIKDNR